MTNRFWDRRLILVGGAGGVGKTTLSAALAVHLANQGLRTIVLTVDPAKRLAQALGFHEISQDIQKVPLPDPEKVLYASMLNTQRYFDKLVERFSKSESQRNKILNNRLYRVAVDHLAGTAEYAAMEQILQFYDDKNYDRIIVDTPPASSAIDLLTAPERMADFMDNKIFRWFQGQTGFAAKIFNRGSQMVLDLLDRFLGNEFLASLKELLVELEGMQHGFRERNLKIREILKSDQTHFLLTTYPSETRYEEAIQFKRTLEQFEIPLAGIWINRVLPLLKTETEDPLILFYKSWAEEQRQWVEKLSRLENRVVLIEESLAPPTNLTELEHLGGLASQNP